MNNNLELRKYYGIKYFDNDNIYVRLYHGSEESRRQREYAHKNLAIEKITQFFFADSRSSAETIAEKIIFGNKDKL